MAGFSKEINVNNGSTLEQGDIICLPDIVDNNVRTVVNNNVSYEALVCHKGKREADGSITKTAEEVLLTPGSLHRAIVGYKHEAGIPIPVRDEDPDRSFDNTNDPVAVVFAKADVSGLEKGAITDKRIQAVIEASKEGNNHQAIVVSKVVEVVTRGFDAKTRRASNRLEDMVTRKGYHYAFA